VVGGGCGYYVVELHDDVRADGVLEGDGMFWGEEPGGCRHVNLGALPGVLGALGWGFGVTDMGVLSCGLRKRTPSSVTCASCSRETI
jgi:hypothetical protein